MADFASFKHGGTQYPLTTGSPNPILRDVDPTLFYMLEYYSSVIQTHIGAKLAEQASGLNYLESGAPAVGQVFPYDPEPWLTENQFKWPLLAGYRKTLAYRYAGTRKVAVLQLEVAYVMKPVTVDEAERFVPFLHAIAAVVDNRTEQGFDPAYTPSTPTGTAGEPVWSAARAGLARVEMKAAAFGGYQPTKDLHFPAVIMAIEAEERSEAVLGELGPFAGIDTTIHAANADGTQVDDFVQFSTHAPPVITSLSVTSGTKAGGTALTINGTGFIVGRRYRALFDGSDASSVVAGSPTALGCLTPAHAAYPTQAVDVVVIDQDGGVSNTLEAAYTFTTP